MDFRSVVAAALETRSPISSKIMFQTLGIDLADAAGFAAGDCSLDVNELERLLTHLGYRLER